MADYIDREAVLMKLMQDGCSAKNVQLITDIPAADVEPVRHGYWDDSLGWIYPYCSVCGNSHMSMRRILPYCPNCGAKMDGGDENGDVEDMGV